MAVCWDIDKICPATCWLLYDDVRFRLSKPETHYATVREDHIIQSYHPTYDFYKQIIHFPRKNHKGKNLAFFSLDSSKHYKGLDTLLQAMPLVIKKMPDMKLVIVGRCMEMTMFIRIWFKILI